MPIQWKKPDPFAKRDNTKRDYKVTISFVVREQTEQSALWKAEQKRRQLKKGRQARKRTWNEPLGRYTYITLPIIEPVIESLEVYGGSSD